MKRAAVNKTQGEFMEKMLLRVQNYARWAFRHESPELQEEHNQNAIGIAWDSYLGSCKRGMGKNVSATPLADMAVRATRAGRILGAKLNSRDVTSDYIGRRSQNEVPSVDKLGTEIQYIISADNYNPADIAQARHDVTFWLSTMSATYQNVARYLSLGYRPSETLTPEEDHEIALFCDTLFTGLKKAAGRSSDDLDRPFTPEESDRLFGDNGLVFD
jgi:hypothetical protein